MIERSQSHCINSVRMTKKNIWKIGKTITKPEFTIISPNIKLNYKLFEYHPCRLLSNKKRDHLKRRSIIDRLQN